LISAKKFSRYRGNGGVIHIEYANYVSDPDISVVSNVLPAKTAEMCRLFREGKIAESADIQLELLPLINALFCEVNPIPVKAAMAAMGYCEDYLRLPLTPMEDGNREKLLSLMREQGINV